MIVTEVENKIKAKNFIFSNKKTKEIQIELKFPVKDIENVTLLFNEASNILMEKYKFSLVQFTAKGVNDNIKIYVYIAL